MGDSIDWVEARDNYEIASLEWNSENENHKKEENFDESDTKYEYSFEKNRRQLGGLLSSVSDMQKDGPIQTGHDVNHEHHDDDDDKHYTSHHHHNNHYHSKSISSKSDKGNRNRKRMRLKRGKNSKSSKSLKRDKRGSYYDDDDYGGDFDFEDGEYVWHTHMHKHKISDLNGNGSQDSDGSGDSDDEGNENNGNNGNNGNGSDDKDGEKGYFYGRGRCPDTGRKGVPCAPSDLAQTCDKFDKRSSFRRCLEACRPSFCCIHDAKNNDRAVPCRDDENCAQYSYCYIVWWKLHDTVGELCCMVLKSRFFSSS